MRFIFDTNVLSETMRESPHPVVAAWLRACPAAAMFTTAISQAEILHGVRRLPEGRRRLQLEAAARAMFEEEFADRILPFDRSAAEAYAELRVFREQAAHPVTTEDAMIAAIAKVNHAIVVTRDSRGFTGCGVDVIDPWQASL